MGLKPGPPGTNFLSMGMPPAKAEKGLPAEALQRLNEEQDLKDNPNRGAPICGDESHLQFRVQVKSGCNFKL